MFSCYFVFLIFLIGCRNCKFYFVLGAGYFIFPYIFLSFVFGSHYVTWKQLGPFEANFSALLGKIRMAISRGLILPHS